MQDVTGGAEGDEADTTDTTPMGVDRIRRWLSSIRGRLSLWRLAISQRVASIPAWVIVLTVAAVVGSISAMVSVMGLARWRNRGVSEIEIPVESECVQDDV